MNYQKNPALESSVKQQLEKLDLNNFKSTSNLLKETSIAKAEINETLRMYPPIWLMGRFATVDLIIGNNRIKKNDNILIFLYINVEMFYESKK